MKKMIISLIFICILLTTSAYAEDGQYIRVGIDYDQSIENTVISSSNALELFDTQSNNSLVVFDNDIYVGITRQWYVESNEVFESLDSAKARMNQLKTDYSSVYIGYNNGYRVYVGHELSKNEALKISKNLNYTVKNGLSLLKIYNNNTLVFIYDCSNSLYFRDTKNYTIKYNGHRYRNSIGFNRLDRGYMNVVNYLNMSEYLYGVLPKEMSKDWPIEALKAQAICARSYAYANIGSFKEKGFDVTDTVTSQVYGGFDVEGPISNQAVDETEGLGIVYKDKYVATFYHSNSGGSTENSEDVWSYEIPYIRAVKDEFSKGMPQYDWSLEMTSKEIADYLKKAGYDIGQLQSIEINDTTSSGHILSISYIGTKGTVELKKENTRKVFGYSQVRSMKFNIEGAQSYFVMSSNNYAQVKLQNAYVMTSNGTVKKITQNNLWVDNGYNVTSLELGSDQFVFRGHGYGHALGMSQWGAKNMAENGYTYDEIIHHYYTNVEIK